MKGKRKGMKKKSKERKLKDLVKAKKLSDTSLKQQTGGIIFPVNQNGMWTGT